MTERGKKYLSDILNAIELIEQFTEGIKRFEQYQFDLKTKSAVERQLSILGEAVNNYRKLDEEFELTDTKQIISFRNRIIHSYGNVDDTIVWAILSPNSAFLRNVVIYNDVKNWFSA